MASKPLNLPDVSADELQMARARSRIRLSKMLPVVRIEESFLGTSWCFAETENGQAFWVNTKTKKVIDSTRNYKKSDDETALTLAP